MCLQARKTAEHLASDFDNKLRQFRDGRKAPPFWNPVAFFSLELASCLSSIWDTTGSAHAKWEGLSIYFDIYIYINRYRYRYRYMYILMCIYIYDVLNCWSRVSQRGDHTARVAMCQSNIGAGAKGCCKGAFPKHHFCQSRLAGFAGLRSRFFNNSFRVK